MVIYILAMRNVIYGVGISLDGYIARRDHSIDFLFMPKDFSMAPFFKTIDVAVMGRKTYDISLSMGGFGKMETYVFSKTLEPGTREGLTFVNAPAIEVIEQIRGKPGKDIWLMGGGEIAREFLMADLVDEIHLGVLPMLIGAGIPAFPSGFPQRDFELTENKTYSRGLISLKYKRVRPVPKSRSPKKRK